MSARRGSGYWRFLRNVLPGPFVRAGFGPDVEGLENIPAGAGAIIASNHLSRADPIFLQLAVHRQLIFAVNVRFYRRRGLGGRAMRWFLNACEAVPVDPAGGRSAADSLVDAAKAALAAGKLFCLYPEGGIARDGRLHKGKSGVGRVVAETRAPVVPVAMLNTDLILPPVRRMPSLQRARIRIGAAITFPERSPERSPELSVDRRDIRAITDGIMHELARLSGRDRVDRYVH